MFGKKFKVLKVLPTVYEKVGDKYPEYFLAYEKMGELDYCIMDDSFGQPSPANYSNTNYAIKLRKRSSAILSKLVKDGYIEVIK